MGNIFDIQRFSIHDGPGIRTTVFFKGCNNTCLWCHNPESLKSKPQIQSYLSKCIGCGKCFEVCNQGCHIIQITENTDKVQRVFLREKCNGCGICADSCFSGALILCGEERTADSIVSEVLSDKPYYDQSGGGVTISGGEPFIQFEFLIELLKKLKENNIHIVVQTALNFDFEKIIKAAPYVDLFMCDFKIFDSEKHKKYIGNDGIRIRENLQNMHLVRKSSSDFIVRTPVIGGVNDTEEEIGSIVGFLNEFVYPKTYELMPYHNLGISKLETLGINEDEVGETAFFKTPSEKKMEELRVLL